MQECKTSRLQAVKNAGIQSRLHAKIQVFRCSGLHDFMHSHIHATMQSGIQVCMQACLQSDIQEFNTKDHAVKIGVFMETAVFWR